MIDAGHPGPKASHTYSWGVFKHIEYLWVNPNVRNSLDSSKVFYILHQIQKPRGITIVIGKMES